MDDVTDTVFRQVVGSLAAGLAAPDLYFTEFVNVDGLCSPGRPRLLKKLRFTEAETPLVAQVWGKSPENFREVARQIADGSLARELGLPRGVNFAGVDLNMGCPVKAVVKDGACSALMNDRALAAEIINATKEGLADRLPLSVKTRTGFNRPDPGWIEFLLGQGLDMLTIHGRTKKQLSEVPADWQAIGQARELRDRLAPGTLIVGNGDVMSRRQGEELAKQHGLDGIMIGRGIFHDPFVFAAASPWPDYAPEQRIDLYRQHVRLFARTWQGRERPIHTLNKFCKIYINNFDGAKELRERLMAAASADALLEIMATAKTNETKATAPA